MASLAQLAKPHRVFHPLLSRTNDNTNNLRRSGVARESSKTLLGGETRLTIECPRFCVCVSKNNRSMRLHRYSKRCFNSLSHLKKPPTSSRVLDPYGRTNSAPFGTLTMPLGFVGYSVQSSCTDSPSSTFPGNNGVSLQRGVKISLRHGGNIPRDLLPLLHC